MILQGGLSWAWSRAELQLEGREGVRLGRAKRRGERPVPCEDSSSCSLPGQSTNSAQTPHPLPSSPWVAAGPPPGPRAWSWPETPCLSLPARPRPPGTEAPGEPLWGRQQSRAQGPSCTQAAPRSQTLACSPGCGAHLHTDSGLGRRRSRTQRAEVGPCPLWSLSSPLPAGAGR